MACPNFKNGPKNGLCPLLVKSKMYCKKRFAKNLHQFSMADRGANEGPGTSINTRNCFLNFLNFHIWKRNDRTLMLFFFIDKYCRWDCFPRNKFGIPLTIFPRWTQMRTGRWGQATDKSISLTKSSTPIFEVIMIGFGHSFFHG
jgi:hypothetical protein